MSSTTISVGGHAPELQPPLTLVLPAAVAVGGYAGQLFNVTHAAHPAAPHCTGLVARVFSRGSLRALAAWATAGAGCTTRSRRADGTWSPYKTSFRLLGGGLLR
jgi:hypothetical protein